MNIIFGHLLCYPRHIFLWNQVHNLCLIINFQHIDLRDDNKKLQLVPTEAKRRKLGTELEAELEKVIHGSIYTHAEGEELSKAETMALESLSIEEAKMRRIELQKHRHLQAAYQQKARRQKKIKSRNFHRHLKRREKKENEKAQNEEESDEGAEMEQKQKDRARERAELRHATTGSKWSKERGFLCVISCLFQGFEILITRSYTEKMPFQQNL